MIVVHIESGLGNQMLSYCEYLALKKMNPDEKIYIENIIFDIPECNDVICQWNGYELDRIFGINAPNIKEYFSTQQWNEIIHDIEKSEFWNKNWNYPVYFTNAFSNAGLSLNNIRGDFEGPNSYNMTSIPKNWKYKLKNTKFGYWIKIVLDLIKINKTKSDYTKPKELFLKTEENIFTGQKLLFKFNGNRIDDIETEIRNTFVFPKINDEKNMKMKKYIESVNSVAIHARRGDMLGCNGYLYNGGYFKRAVKYMKRHVKNPVFVFFCDPGSIEWCKENEKVFGLDFKKDIVKFVDWNDGENSFRDMQLMTYCKHNIITNSTFGFWGAYLNDNPNKITISPDKLINTTNHCY